MILKNKCNSKSKATDLLHVWCLFVVALASFTMTACAELNDQVVPMAKEGVANGRVAEGRVAQNEVVIYSPAPSASMLHAHNVELGDALNTCGISRNVKVVAMALPDSINVINTLDELDKRYHLPIVTTLDFKTAMEGNAPAWHGYNEANSDLRFVTSLYDVAYGLLVVNTKIESPLDLIGKRIAVPARPSAVRWFTEVLLRDSWGILDQVTLVDIVPPKVPVAIANKEVDVVAWNIMSETPNGFLPLLPMILKNKEVYWLDIDQKTVNDINAKNPFATEQTLVQLDNIIGVNGGESKTVNLLSFRQALAAWTTTPDDLIQEIVACMKKTDFSFGSKASFAEKQFKWPHLNEADIHQGAK